MERSLKLTVALLSSLALAGCMGNTATMPNGDKVAMRTVSDGLDRSASVTDIYSPQGALRHRDLTVGDTVGGRMAVAVVGGMGAAVVNGITAASIAGDNKCQATTNPDGTNYGCNNIIVGGSQAVAGSTSTADVDVNIGGGTPPCGYCGNEYD